MVGMTPSLSDPLRGEAAPFTALTKSCAEATRLRARSDDLGACGGQANAAPVALDELHAKLVLELLDAGRKGRLGDEECLRGLPEVEAAGEFDQVAELAQRRERVGCHC